MAKAIKIGGDWYDGRQSKKQVACLFVSIDAVGENDSSHVNIVVAPIDASTSRESAPSQQPLFSGRWSDANISSRLGNTPRYVNFPDGQKFESRENDEIDQLISQLNPKQKQSLAYRLETHWRYVLISVLLTVVVTGWAGIYGVPLASKAIAYALPSTLMDKAGEQTLEILDENFLNPTELTPAVRARVREHFAGIIDEHPEQAIRLYFRSSPEIGANAFALPNGSIIFTDEMIKLAEHDDELLSVMAHEIGHVVKRHGMRGVIQGSFITFGLILLTGDLSATTELFLGIPVILTQLGYSRDFEREADDYALNYLIENNIDTENFSNLMSRLEHSHSHGAQENTEKEGSGVEGANEQADASESKADADKASNRQWQRYLSTHPGIEERIEKFKN